MHPRLLRLHPRRVVTIIIRVRAFAGIRRVRIMAGELGLLRGARARLRLVRRPVRSRDLLLVQLAVAACMVAEAAAGAGEV